MARKSKGNKVLRKRRIQSLKPHDSNRLQLRRSLDWLIDKSSFKNLSFHGNTKWECKPLVGLAVLWVWSSLPQLTEAFKDARSNAMQLWGEVPVTSYQGFLKALTSSTSKLMPLLQIRMHELINNIGGKWMFFGKWVPIAMDGTTSCAPWTKENELKLRSPNHGQGKNAKHRIRKAKKSKDRMTKGESKTKSRKAFSKINPPSPQIWLTMLWHIQLGLPWCWKVGPVHEAERTHVRDMLKTNHFLENTLFVGDAGFVGYDFWRSILEHRFQFLVRVGANVKLLTNLCDYRKDRAGIVYCWPKGMMNKCDPMRLRLIRIRVNKKQSIWLLTSVIEKRHLSDAQMGKLYSMRWGIELQFRAWKQTFDQHTLRSRKPERVLVEVEWSVFGMAAIELVALREQLQDSAAKPAKLSFAKSLNAVRHCLNNLDADPSIVDGFRDGLQKALIDCYERKSHKAGRYHRTKKPPPQCKAPQIRKATAPERQKAHQLEAKIAA